jgi:hypothetical protein
MFGKSLESDCKRDESHSQCAKFYEWARGELDINTAKCDVNIV